MDRRFTGQCATDHCFRDRCVMDHGFAEHRFTDHRAVGRGDRPTRVVSYGLVLALPTAMTTTTT